MYPRIIEIQEGDGWFAAATLYYTRDTHTVLRQVQRYASSTLSMALHFGMKWAKDEGLRLRFTKSVVVAAKTLWPEQDMLADAQAIVNQALMKKLGLGSGDGAAPEWTNGGIERLYDAFDELPDSEAFEN